MMEKDLAVPIDYSLWKKDHAPVLESMKGKKIFLLYSGGKDSSVSMHLLLKACKEFGFSFKAHAGAFPVERYTETQKDRLTGYWQEKGVDILWYDLGKDADWLDQAENPCASCQKVRREMLNRVLRSTVNDWSNLVLVVSYSLWDVVSYATEHLLAGVFSRSHGGISPEMEKRFMETSQRFYPFLSMKEGYSVFRPLVKYNGCDVLKTVEDESLPVIGVPCRFKDFRPKRILEKYYEKMGLRFEYDDVVSFARQTMGLRDSSAYTKMDKEDYLSSVF
jgi:tRNA(Ile)-lysidine synthase TilS/MesJ